MLLEKLKYQQWKNTNAVIKWFKDTNNRDNSKFIQIDIEDIYPSITKETVDPAILFAHANTKISNDDIWIIKHSGKSLLFHNTEAWGKKIQILFWCYYGESSQCRSMWTCRDVVTTYKTHRPKCCWVIHKWWLECSKELKMATKRINWGRSIYKYLVQVQVFTNFGFKTEIKTNLTEVHFLDVTFSLIKEAFRP